VEAVDMAASIFKAAWWPIYVAVAWVLTRDRVFVERCSRPGRSLRSVAVALAVDKVRERPTKRHFKRASAAWSALREQIAAGNIRASGTPFRRTSDLQGSVVETNEIAREIPAAEIASLRLQDDGKDMDCLVPEDWRVAHGSSRNNLRGYRNNRALRDDVLRAFPADVSNVSDAADGNENTEVHNPPEQPHQLRVHAQPTRERASRAIQELYPNGVPDQATLPNAKLCRSVGDWLKEKKLPGVSDPTILRAAGRRK
jgi:hypothetical protein